MASMVDRLRDRGPAAIAVVALHVVAVVAISAHRIAVEGSASTPIFVDFLEARVQPVVDRPPPPHVVIERPTPTIMAPEAPVVAVTTFEMAPAPVQQPRPQPAAAQVADTTPMVEARFDADYLKNPSPSYPPLSRRMREQGLVVLRVHVSEDGAAREVMFHQRSGHPRLDEAALATVKKWRFIPARRGDTVVDSWVLVPIEFALNS